MKKIDREKLNKKLRIIVWILIILSVIISMCKYYERNKGGIYENYRKDVSKLWSQY
jgi:hypothetical protein